MGSQHCALLLRQPPGGESAAAATADLEDGIAVYQATSTQKDMERRLSVALQQRFPYLPRTNPLFPWSLICGTMQYLLAIHLKQVHRSARPIRVHHEIHTTAAHL